MATYSDFLFLLTFQSQLNPIASGFTLAACLPVARFNPNLIQLRVGNILFDPIKRECFNPNLIQLRVESFHSMCTQKFERFNPNLIQLRGAQGFGTHRL